MQLLHLPPNFRFEFSLGGQVELIAAGEDLLFLLFSQCVLDNRVVLSRAENQAERRVVSVCPALAIEVIDVELELAKVLMSKFANFQVNQHVALQHYVIEHQVHVEMIAIERETLLTCDKGEPLAEFEKKGLQVINEGLLKAGFHQPWRFR